MIECSVARPVRRIWGGTPVLEGAGVQLRRAFGHPERLELDPFLLLDDIRSEDPEDYRRGFPWHPHRGIETITYVLDGEVEHGDSLGNRGLLRSGDLQLITAGGGIVHQEMLRGDRRGRMAGFQMWINLPSDRKMMAPRYRGVRREDIPRVKTPDGASALVIAGEVGGRWGPLRDVAKDLGCLDVSIPPDGSFRHCVNPEHTVFAYVFEGRAFFGPPSSRDGAQAAGDGTVVVFGPGHLVVVRTGRSPVRFLLASGRPFRQPIAWRGPIVMNTEEELETAFEEYRAGRFVRGPGS